MRIWQTDTIGRIILSLLAGSAWPGIAVAQVSPSAQPPADKAQSGIADIVVTAQRRSESLMQVPLAIQAVTENSLRSQGITRIQELQVAIPGLSIQYGQGGAYSPFLRGVGNALSGNYAENSIATYIDDVPRPRNRAGTDLPNVERIEVLKGPQGALYGRNATGGAISIITKEPDGELAGRGSASYGSFGTLELQGYVNVPLSEQLFFNAAISHRERDAPVRNLAAASSNPLQLPGRPAGFPSGGSADDRGFERGNSEYYDAKLKFQATDTLSFTLRGDYMVADDTLGSGWIQRNPAVLAGILSALTGTTVTPDDFPNGGKSGSSTYADSLPVHEVRDYGGSLKIVGDLDGFTLTSITAYRKSRELSSIEIDATPLPFAGFSAYFRTKTFSQEVRAASSGDGPLQWLVGATYFDDRANDATAGEIGLILVPGVAGTLTREQILSGQYPRISLPATVANLKAKSWSIFGQASYAFDNGLEIVASGRYTEERRRLTFPAQLNTGNVEIARRRREHAFTPAVTINYDMGGTGLIYARYAKGYKSGGLNDLLNPTARDVNSDPVGINEFAPEKLTSYEIGYKADLFDRRVRLTAAAYHYDYRNIQFQRVLSAEATSVVLNAQKARINGAEVEISGRLGDFATLTVGANYNDARYKRFQVNDITNFDASGNRMISAPKLSLNSSLDMALPISPTLDFIGFGALSYRSGQYFDPENTIFNFQKRYAIANGRMGVRTHDGRYGAYVFARNLFDKRYAVFGQTNSTGTVVNYGDRRVIGATVELQF